MTTKVVHARENTVSAPEFIDVLKSSGLAERRPVDDSGRVQRMLDHANLIVMAREGGTRVGVSRALTDFAYCIHPAATHRDVDRPRGVSAVPQGLHSLFLVGCDIRAYLAEAAVARASTPRAGRSSC